MWLLIGMTMITSFMIHVGIEQGFPAMLPSSPFELINLVYLTIVLGWALVIMRVVVGRAERDYLEELRRERDRLTEDKTGC
jgi:hypothetical protein